MGVYAGRILKGEKPGDLVLSARWHGSWRYGRSKAIVYGASVRSWGSTIAIPWRRLASLRSLKHLQTDRPPVNMRPTRSGMRAIGLLRPAKASRLSFSPDEPQLTAFRGVGAP
jgi:hypothetical protein